jgi:hypothetical protein
MLAPFNIVLSQVDVLEPVTACRATGNVGNV